ncbi:MAG TPA: 23S rRNA (adenine(2503)-C(2))-methyltransferase RlmN [Acidimicrobiales bacterium]|jgi:23S rRNA (adenine2503-C2)-methyltransferase|nr:23S rRNA (adenine(2503)-C(2))-methyltransferase RlmN [Acidimicrobiales bacterium]
MPDPVKQPSAPLVTARYEGPTRFEVNRDALAGLLAGEPRYRVDQVWQAIHAGREPAEITNVPKALRARLDQQLPAGLRIADEQAADAGETVKWLYELRDGKFIESVLMHYTDRSTVCVSSQAGCAMACSFCATGQGGFDRHLTSGEIVEQVVRAARRCRDAGRRLDNVVLMGGGEPLANFDNVWRAIERMHADLGLSARHLTVSTVGIVPGIARLAAAPLPVNLAVSLHAANDELRDELVPINRRYPLRRLAAACHEYLAVRNRRLSFEWALIDGVNDRERDAAELAAFARPLRAHVNLIPLNPTPGYGVSGTPPVRVAAFRDELRERGVNATVRQTRGRSIDAACGQLRANHTIAVAAPARRA